MSEGRRVAHLIGFSAPPVLHLDEFVRLLTSKGWDTYVILSPTAAIWTDVELLAQVSGHAIRVEPRLPDQHDPLPPAETVIAAPITFNSLNKCAMGISDTLALGLLNEALGLDINVTMAPCVKSSLRAHPAYDQNVRVLIATGAVVLDPFDIARQTESGAATMDWERVMPD